MDSCLGTGCGPYSDSPTLDFCDLLGYYDRNTKFVKKYADFPRIALDGVVQFVRQCHNGTYPSPSLDTQKISRVLTPKKDVDAITTASVGGLLTDVQVDFAPCIATAYLLSATGRLFHRDADFCDKLLCIVGDSVIN